MSIPVTCPSCVSKFTAPDHAAGRKAKCPKCSGSLDIPGPTNQTPAPPPIPLDQETQASVASPTPKLDACPSCGSSNAPNATTCPKCGAPQLLGPPRYSTVH
jgi:ribosomal protein L40E